MHGVIKPRRHCEIICVPRDWKYVPPADLEPMSLPQGDIAARISTYVSQRHDASILMTPTVLFHLGRLVRLLGNCAPYIRLHNGQIDIAVCGYRMTYGGIPSRWRTLTRAGLTDSYEEIRRKTSLIKLVSDELFPAFE
jgi:hypothetical protein